MTTHAELFRAAYACGLTSKQRLHVQYMRHHIGLCAELVECFESRGQEWVKLWNTFDGYFIRPASAIRICQGATDRGCACADGAISRQQAQRADGGNSAGQPAPISDASTDRHFSRAGVVAPHESPNFRTLPISREGV
ncbi:MAG: hypothetical protein ACK5NE_08050 [Brachymonas sp.]